MTSISPLTRRRFLSHSATLAGAAALTKFVPVWTASAADLAREFRSAWDRCHDRVWLGPEYWAAPLQDWRIAGGRVELTNAAPGRHIHLLTHQLGARKGGFRVGVKLGRIDGTFKEGKGSAGFTIGSQGPLREYRNNALYGKGLDCGVTAEGAMFIGPIASAKAGAVNLRGRDCQLYVTGEPTGDTYRVTLTVHDGFGEVMGQLTREGIPAEQLVGNVVLVANFGAPAAGGGKAKAKDNAKNKNKAAAANPGTGLFWFQDWTASGPKIEAHPDQSFGPILWSQYTLSGGVLKMSAQMPPLGAREAQSVRLQVKRRGDWATLAEEPIHPEARTATFRVENWDATKDAEYRLAYTQAFTNGKGVEHYWTGTVRRDPVDQNVITVGDVSCNIHTAFPNHEFVAKMGRLDPDLLAFTGDQFYESTAGFGVQRAPLAPAMLDYLRKWYIHGWTWRELMRDRPSISIPDDHDVYQGNLWGEGGEGRKTTQEAGGYDMPSEWVNVVHRTQTSHHPDPYDRTPGKRGTTNWYGPLTYGRVGFAILADRQYKSGPEGKIPPTDTKRGDHVMDPNFDPRKSDVPGVELLGATQEKFLAEWVADWRGVDMKSVISQTIFTAMATTHGGPGGILRADHDTNAWPQTARNRAVRTMRKAFAFHIAGDQHLPAVVQYGVDTHRDGGVAFAGPAVNVGYPRWWEPQTAPWTKPRGESLTGDFTDNFGLPLTVLAVKNGAKQPPQDDVMQLMELKASGLGLVRFDKRQRTVTVECWPYLADVTKRGTQFPGWPLVVKQLDNYGRATVAHLPTLKFSGVKNPVVQLFEDNTGELVYALRVHGQEFQPHVFVPGNYTVKAGDPDTGQWTELKNLAASAGNRATLTVKVAAAAR
jgi:phosphodiesterase/alkaline phosphatase D-like protein